MMNRPLAQLGTQRDVVGKRVVVTADGSACDLRSAAIRNVARIVDASQFSGRR